MLRILQTARDTQLAFSVDRGGKLIDLVATPRRRAVVRAFGTTRAGILGVAAKDKPEYWHFQHYDFVDSLKLAGAET
jgi:regulator of sigma E protease